MAKSNYTMKWYDYLVMGVVSIVLSLLIVFRWFSSMIGDRTYEELGSSKTSGLAYTVAQIEQSNWRFVLAAFFIGIASINFYNGYKKYQKKEITKIPKMNSDQKTLLKEQKRKEKEIKEREQLEKEIRKRSNGFKRRF